MPARKRKPKTATLEVTQEKLLSTLVTEYRHAEGEEAKALELGDIGTAYYWQGKQAGIRHIAKALGIDGTVAARIESQPEEAA